VPLEARLLTGLALASIVAYTATPVAIRVAHRLEFFDRPMGYKGHGAPTPYLGGAAVITAFLLVVVVLTGDWERTLPVVGGVAGLWVIGTIDDRRTVSPLARVIAEIVLALGLWASGMGWDLGAGAALDAVVTCLWVVGVVNAFNLFDNMDGAAGSMAAVVSAAVAVLGVVGADVWLAVAGAALCGACVGFLPYNLTSPAKIFLGDGGSMPIGFAVAALVMGGAADAAPAWQALAMGVLLVGVPALDTALVVVSRSRRGIPLLTGGRDHLTHRTRQRVSTARAVAVTLGSVQALVSALALVAVSGSSLVLVAAVVLYLVGAGVTIARLDSGFMSPSAEAGSALPVRGSRIAALGGLLAALGVALGLNPLAESFYDSEIWVVSGLGIAVVVTGLAIARPVRLSRVAWLTLGAIAALAAWALVSASWADSVQQAVVEANRLMVYAGLLAALLLLVRSDRTALVLLLAIGATIAGLGAVTVLRMMGDGAASLFVGGRLDAPLGYINGQAAFHLLGFWLCLAVAEQRRRSWVAGLAVGAATLLGCLIVLSQSRGVALASLGSAVMVLAVVPGRTRRGWLLMACAAGITVAGPSLLAVFDGLTAGRVQVDQVHAAASRILLVAVATGVAWAAAATAVERFGDRREDARRWAALALTGLALLGALVVVARQAEIRDRVSEQYHAFVRLGVEPQGSALSGAGARSRLVSGAGNRYDYWRIAVDTFRTAPLRGVGAGNYDGPYFRQRSTTEDIRQPHSIQLQALAELGLIGALLLIAALGAVAVGAWRTAQRAQRPGPERMLAVGAIGAGTAWLVHTSVDWLHLLPGLTGIALACAAALIRDPRAPVRAVEEPRRERPRLFPAVAVGLALAVATISLARQGLAEYWRESAQETLRVDPAKALVHADRALRLDPEDVAAYYAKAAALARFDRGGAAVEALREAARREPDDFVTYALLGDLSVRRGRLDEAKRYYAQASRLNPRDAGLRALASDPIAALSANTPGENG
jgi:UDP-GlcNAc:undecaprenyl-phosphate GlcNAc-1-phosphate transferase